MTAMPTPHPLCKLASCNTRHPFGAPHADSGGKTAAKPRRTGKKTATLSPDDIIPAGPTEVEVTLEWIEQIPGVRCKQCSHVWVPVSDRKPKRCPDCMSRGWSK